MKDSQHKALKGKRSTKIRRNLDARRKRLQSKRFATQPPVMVRNPTRAGTERSSVRSKRAKRRFYVTLDTSGTEMRLPSLPMVDVGWRWVSLVLTGVLVFFLYYALTSPTYRVEAAKISGLRRVPDMAVNTALDISGEPIFTMDTAKIEETLLNQFPEFITVDTEVGLPNTVTISVTERVPVITWILDGNITLVDKDGLKFPLRFDTENYPYPVVEASSAPPMPIDISVDSINEDTQTQELLDKQIPLEEQQSLAKATPFITPEMVAAVLSLSKFAPEETPMIYDSRHGLGWKDPRGWEVYFGDATEIDLKLRVYGAIVERLQTEGIYPLLISVEYVHAPFYRMEK